MSDTQETKSSAEKTDPGLDGYLWQLWEYFEDGKIILQRACDADGCEQGLLYYPARFCNACRGTGLVDRTFLLQGASVDESD